MLEYVDVENPDDRELDDPEWEWVIKTGKSVAWYWFWCWAYASGGMCENEKLEPWAMYGAGTGTGRTLGS